jgi:hypothetical protein
MTPADLPFPGPGNSSGLVAPAAGCDCRTCAFFTGNPEAAEPVCSGCSSDCAYCGCSRARAVPLAGGDARGGCATCPVRCGSRTDIATWMADAGGTLTLDGTHIPGMLPAGLPAFIPQVASIPSITRLDAGLSWPAYATGLRRVFSWRTHQVYPKLKGRTARDVLGLSAGQLAVLAMYGDDPLVEGWWTWRRARGLATELAAQQWDLVLAPNYSVYGDQPRAEHLINMRRSALAAAELAAEGVTAVPNLYWYRLEDLRRWASWACGDAGVPAVAVNVQTMRTRGDWDGWLYPGLCWLAENLPSALPVILTGLSRPDRIAAAGALLGTRLTVISQCPYQYAARGAVMTPAGRADLHAQPADAFAASVRYAASLMPSGKP